MFHLFFTCQFSEVCWEYLGIVWNTTAQPTDMVIEAKQNFGSSAFREIMITGCWGIWCHRNAIIFDSAGISLVRWKATFREELSKTIIRAKPSLKAFLNPWLCNLN
uniref:Uncharacterized protein n=1 Tax=Setaria viridis TaxID=4556 RepID=A0A4U6VEF5_SETVI|nr:hypothetical protein SEVIR_3G287000v2 [Setaria viridis]